ncbi:hypothetical protein PTKIN_Ptkin12aG0218400 [Pterospermum kingtungense]
MSDEHIPKQTKKLTLHDFFKRKIDGESSGTNPSPNINVPIYPSKSQRVEVEDVERVHGTYLERDPDLCSPIWSYPVDIRDDVRMSYIKMGPVVHQSTSHLLMKDFKIGRELMMESDVRLHNMKVEIMHCIALDKWEAKGAYKDIKSFEFVFILHLMNNVLGISNILCQAFQMKSQDILNAICLASTTKVLLQKLREDGCNTFIKDVELFCERYDIEIPDMTAWYIKGTRRSCQQKNHITIEHYYRINIFNVVIDFHLMELNSRFTEQTMELLTLSSALSLIDGFKSFKIDDICTLARKFYAQDFTGTELDTLRRQLEHYDYAIVHHSKFQTMGSLFELFPALAETRRSEHFFLVDRLIRLVLTLHVSIATTERAFSAMNLLKTQLRNKMDNDFLTDFMVVYFEREIADSIDVDSIIDEFDEKPRRVKHRI